MESLIGLLIAVLLFAIAAYGLWWLCTRFQMPPPVFWIVGAILIIIVLLYVANRLGIPGIKP